MDKLLAKLHEIKKSLKPGTVEGGRNMPTIKTPFDNGPKTNSTTGTQKLKGIGPGSKVNPVKQAEQVQNQDIKDIKMKEAQAALKVKPLDLKKDEDKTKYLLNKPHSYDEQTKWHNARIDQHKQNYEKATNPQDKKYHMNLLNR